MHPLIAFLTFVFSPSQDWLLKQSFELFVNPQDPPAIVESYNRIQKQYPSAVKHENGSVVSADTVAIALWADLLNKKKFEREAVTLWKELEKDAEAPADIRVDAQLRLGERALEAGNFDLAIEYFTKITSDENSPRLLQASVGQLTTALAKNDLASATEWSTRITEQFGSPAIALYPLGLTEFAQANYEKAISYFSQMEDDPRAVYYTGLSLRRLDKTQQALQAWQSLKKPGTDSLWLNLADYQLAETYFAMADNRLSGLMLEKGYAQAENEDVKQKFMFRLASLDFRFDDYENVLTRLEPMIKDYAQSDFSDRVLTLVSESLIHSGRSEALFKMLNSRKHTSPTRANYELAWSQLFSKRYSASIATAQKGLESYYDADYTPRLMLIQALAAENMGEEAEALATFQTLADRFPKSRSTAIGVHWLARAYMRAGRWREVVTHVSYAWQQVNDDYRRFYPETAYWLGEAHLRLARYEDADMYFAQFLSISDPGHEYEPNALFQRSNALAKLNKPDEAIGLLARFKQIANPEKDAALITLAQLQEGNILFNERKYEPAVIAYRLAGEQPKAMYYQGLALYRMDYFSDAVETWTKLAAAHPADALADSALFKAGRTQFELGLATSAVQTFGQLVSAYPNSPHVKQAMLQSAHALYNAGDFTGAAPYYASYIERFNSPDDVAMATPFLASSYVKSGKTISELHTLLAQLPPTDIVASIEWEEGAKNYNDKKYPESSGLFASLLTGTPAHENSPSAHFFRGESLFQQSQWKEAEGAFAHFIAQHAESGNENIPTARFHKGISQFNQDKLMLAAQTFEEFLQKHPTDNLAPDAKQNMMLCYHSLGNWETEQTLNIAYSNIAAPSETPAAAETTQPTQERAAPKPHQLLPGTFTDSNQTPESVASNQNWTNR